LVIFFYGLGNVSAADGDTIYVNGSSGNDLWNGQSATYQSGTIGPKLSIKNATGTVNKNGTVNIANGQYTGVNNTNITISKNLDINGQSKEGTIINGTGTNWIFNINSGINVTISNLTLTNGNSGGSGGAAIYNYGTCTVNSSTFTGNTANGNGGAILNVGTLTVTNNSTFNGNTATDHGGAIYNTGSGTLTVNNTTFTTNTANGLGGAICNIGTLTVTGSTFTGNTANTYYGGAIYNTGSGTLTVTGSTFTGNTAFIGGAIFTDGIATVNFNRIVGNTASTGSAIYNFYTTLDASLNWWGSNADPKGNVYGNVTVTPWLVLNITANPAAIVTGATSIITADLLHDSGILTNPTHPDLYYHDPVFGHVPDGIPVNFSSDAKGNVNPTTNTTTNGKANTTFTGNTLGVSTVSATVDATTVNTDVNVQDTNPPVVSSVDPADAANNIPVNKVITITFNKDIQAGFFGPYNTISLFDGTKYISLIKNIAGNILTLTPTKNLIPGTTYTINIPYFAIADLTGNLLQSTYTSTFNTIPNIIHPTINSIDPVNGATDIPLNQVITITFNKDIQTGLFGPYNSISLFDGTKYISLIKNIAGNILTLTPTKNLIPGTTYTINIPYFAIADLTGNLLQSTYTSTFNTIPNIIHPTINSIDPVNGATDIPLNQVITITFNKDIQTGLFGPYNSISLFDGTEYIHLIKNIAGNILTLTPTKNLIPGTTYTINIPYFAIADLTGNLLQNTYTSTFTTA
jgi:predicted outer membrane repeat protein